MIVLLTHLNYEFSIDRLVVAGFLGHNTAVAELLYGKVYALVRIFLNSPQNSVAVAWHTVFCTANKNPDIYFINLTP